MYGDKHKQKRKSLLPIAGTLKLLCNIKILLPNNQVRNIVEEGSATAPNVQKYITKMYHGAMQNAMYKATDKIGKTGLITKVQNIYSHQLLYPNSVDVKIKRVNIKNKYYNQVRMEGKVISTTKWTPKREKDINDFSNYAKSFDSSMVSGETLEKQNQEQDDYFDKYRDDDFFM